MLSDLLPMSAVVMAKKAQNPHAALENKEKFFDKLLTCTLCRLCETRTQVVVGEGNPKAELMVIGEGPGEQEDLQGRPFVGLAGKLLDKMLLAISLERKNIYIANIVKCRPPQNRLPLEDEIQKCFPYLLRQIEMIQPKFILTLGKTATQTILQTKETISKLRGQVFMFGKINVIPTFHPAYLLRNPIAKKEAWEDLKKLAQHMGLALPTLTKGHSPSP